MLGKPAEQPIRMLPKLLSTWKPWWQPWIVKIERHRLVADNVEPCLENGLCHRKVQMIRCTMETKSIGSPAGTFAFSAAIAR
jgi:hypothetical protein